MLKAVQPVRREHASAQSTKRLAYIEVAVSKYLHFPVHTYDVELAWAVPMTWPL